MIDFLIAPENFMFAAALMLMLLIGLVEALGFGLAALDSGPDVDVESGGSPLLDWLGFGRLPLLMLLVLALAAFGLAGIALQQAALGLTGHLLPMPYAAGGALLAALPLTALLSRPLARILPADETTAISLDALVGRRGRIILGAAESGSPARARVRDVHGQSHYLLVEPHLPGERLHEGDEILLIAREATSFRAIAVTPHIHLNEGETP
jgi:hypothetical protein